MLTDKQLEARKADPCRSGASEIASILGLNPWETAYDLFLRKTNKIIEVPKQSINIEIGNRLEPAILRWFKDKHGGIIRNQKRVSKTLPLRSTIDAILISSGEPVEAKTSGFAFSQGYKEWGLPATNQVPLFVLAQAHAQFMCLNDDSIDICWNPVIIPQKGFQEYIIKRLKWFEDVIANEVYKFVECIRRDVPPEDRAVSLEVVKRLRKIPSKTVYFSFDGFVADYVKLNKEYKALEKERDNAKAKLLAELGNAEKAVIEGHNKDLTCFEQARKYFDDKQFQQDHPILYEQYMKKTNYRVMRFAKKED